MPARPLLLILPGVTADERKLARCRELAQARWPAVDVRVVDFRSRLRGVAASGRWLDRWCRKNLPDEATVFLLAYILGGAALAYAPELARRSRRVVILRSRYQEAVPRDLRRRFTACGAAMLFGRAVADLGRPGYWPPGFRVRCPHLVLVETGCSRLAARLGVAPLSDAELGVTAYKEIDTDHDTAYDSAALMDTATAWLKS